MRVGLYRTRVSFLFFPCSEELQENLSHSSGYSLAAICTPEHFFVLDTFMDKARMGSCTNILDFSTIASCPWSREKSHNKI